MSRARGLLALLLLAGAAQAAADPPAPEGFGSDARALEAWHALEQDRPIRARELAERLLAEQPDSYAAHCLLAVVLRRAEGSPAAALHHVRLCRAGFEARHGADPDPDAPWFWHRLALHELYAASEELERHADSLVHLDALERYHPGLIDAFRGWPLLSLGRLDEARAAAHSALARRANRVQVAKAWTVLCALEAQLGDVQASYAACRAALDAGPNPDDRAVRLVNVAEAARALQRFDEVEVLLREATAHFAPGVLASPWLQLVELYVAQGRIPEAAAALREMLDWQRRQPPATRAHTGAQHDRAAALFRLAAGRPADAARIAARALASPDRAGEISASRAQLEWACALVARASCRTAAAERLEQASWSAPGPRLLAWLDAARLGWCAWRAERRAAALLASPGVLRDRIELRAPGAVGVPEWLEPDAVAIAGPGVMQGLLQGHARVHLAESASLRGIPAEALAHASAALADLPDAEVLLRARAAVLAGEAARALGDAPSAAAHFALALQLDGGALRRAGSALPVRFEPDESHVARIAARVLRASPRLARAEDGLRLELRDQAGRVSACLMDARAGKLVCAEVESRPAESSLHSARRLAAAFHTRAFAPRLDPTQRDLAGLDGALATRD